MKDAMETYLVALSKNVELFAMNLAFYYWLGTPFWVGLAAATLAWLLYGLLIALWCRR